MQRPSHERDFHREPAGRTGPDGWRVGQELIHPGQEEGPSTSASASNNRLKSILWLFFNIYGILWNLEWTLYLTLFFSFFVKTYASTLKTVKGNLRIIGRQSSPAAPARYPSQPNV